MDDRRGILQTLHEEWAYRLSDEFVGPPQPGVIRMDSLQVLMGMDFGAAEMAVQTAMMASRDGMVIIHSGHGLTDTATLRMIQEVYLATPIGRRRSAKMDIPSILQMIEPDPIGYRVRDDEPLPRPPRSVKPVKQAPRRAFRQVMRSVNRNR